MTVLSIFGIAAALGLVWLIGYVLYMKHRFRTASEAEMLARFSDSEKEEAQPRSGS